MLLLAPFLRPRLRRVAVIAGIGLHAGFAAAWPHILHIIGDSA